MWTVVGTLMVMGILVFGLNFMARERNVAAHRVYFGEVAENLAEAGLEHVGRRMRDALFGRRFLRAQASLDLGSLFRVLLLDNENLRRLFASQWDSEKLMRQLLGDDYRYGLDHVVRQFRGAKLAVTLNVDPQPLVKDPVVVDPVEKRVRFILRSKADFRGVTRILESGYEIKVVHPFPPVTSKFTLFASEADAGQGYNTFRNDTAGRPYTPDDFPPVVFNNTPREEVQDITLIRENLPRESTDPFAQLLTVREALERRGWIFLGTGSSGREIHLNLTAGPVLSEGLGYGQYFELYNPLPASIGGMNASPLPFKVSAPPAFFRAAVPDPLHDGVFQNAIILFLYNGFHYPAPDGNMRESNLLGSSLQTESSNVLQLYGSYTSPSRTKVFGNVWQDYVRYSVLGVDRDQTTTDEELQAANLQALGLPPYNALRDGRMPFFKFASEKDFEDDLKREAAGLPPSALSTIPAFVPNVNFTAANAIRNAVDTGAVPPEARSLSDRIIDPGWPTVPLDPASYRYARMFDGTFDTGDSGPNRAGYANFMSRVEAIPMNEILDYMFYAGYIPPRQAPSFRQPTLPEGNEFYQQAENVKIAFHDPLHEGLGLKTYFEGDLGEVLKPGGEPYGRETRPTPDARSGFIPPRLEQPSPVEEMMLARTYREYATVAEFLADTYNPAGNILALTQCVRVREGDLVLPAGLRYVGSGAVVLMEGSITSQGLVPLKDPFTGLDSTLSLVSLRGDIVLGDGIHSAAFCAPRGSVQRAGSQAMLTDGTLAARSFPAGMLTRGGVLAYKGVYDPATDLREPNGSAYIDYYQAAMSDVPIDWRRVTQ